MLKLGRIDTFFVSELAFLECVPENERKNYKTVLQEQKPFGIYISKKYLEKNPAVMDKINHAIMDMQINGTSNN